MKSNRNQQHVCSKVNTMFNWTPTGTSVSNFTFYWNIVKQCDFNRCWFVPSFEINIFIEPDCPERVRAVFQICYSKNLRISNQSPRLLMVHSGTSQELRLGRPGQSFWRYVIWSRSMHGPHWLSTLQPVTWVMQIPELISEILATTGCGESYALKKQQCERLNQT